MTPSQEDLTPSITTWNLPETIWHIPKTIWQLLWPSDALPKHLKPYRIFQRERPSDTFQIPYGNFPKYLTPSGDHLTLPENIWHSLRLSETSSDHLTPPKTICLLTRTSYQDPLIYSYDQFPSHLLFQPCPFIIFSNKLGNLNLLCNHLCGVFSNEGGGPLLKESNDSVDG